MTNNSCCALKKKKLLLNFTDLMIKIFYLFSTAIKHLSKIWIRRHWLLNIHWNTHWKPKRRRLNRKILQFNSIHLLHTQTQIHIREHGAVYVMYTIVRLSIPNLFLLCLFYFSSSSSGSARFPFIQFDSFTQQNINTTQLQHNNVIYRGVRIQHPLRLTNTLKRWKKYTLWRME